MIKTYYNNRNRDSEVLPREQKNGAEGTRAPETGPLTQRHDLWSGNGEEWSIFNTRGSRWKI